MTSRQHQSWINAGRPDSGLALPLAQLRDTLRAAGFVVYDWPNDAHLDAEPPEDHTFYSETGWPGVSPKWWRHAIDIMPKAGAAGARELWLLGARIAADRQAGRITWLKYINRPPTSNLGNAIQEAWEPNYAKRASSDAGHLHLSSITGVETLSSPYNPLAPVGAPQEGDDMQLSDLVPGTGTAATNGHDRTFGQIIGDQAKLRAVLIGELDPAAAGFGPSTPLAKLLALTDGTGGGNALPTGPIKVTGQLTLGS